MLVGMKADLRNGTGTKNMQANNFKMILMLTSITSLLFCAVACAGGFQVPCIPSGLDCDGFEVFFVCVRWHFD